MALAPEPAPAGVDVPVAPALDHLASASRLLTGAFDGAPVGLFLAAPDGSVRWCNGTWRRLFACDATVPIDQGTWLAGVAESNRVAVTAGLDDVVAGGGPFERMVALAADGAPPGEGRLLLTLARAVPDDPSSGVVGAAMVLAPDVESGPSWAHRAMHDPLTGLPNRILLLDHLRKGLARGDRDGSRLAALYFDVDRFKTINDTQGHDAGDALLAELARRIRDATRPQDTVARLGGDEFVIVFDQVDDEEHAVDGAERVLSAIESAPFPLPRIALDVTVSAGLAVSRPGIAPNELLREADIAMYRAKERGRARLEVYDEVLRRRAQRRVDLAHRLHGAIRDESIDVHYQPIVDLRSGEVVAAEALARWTGLREGDDFIGVALDTGMIVDLGALVLRRACAEAREWAGELGVEGGSSPAVHVNLASRQMGDPRLVDLVGTTLADTGLPPSALCLEIPEPVITDDRVAARSTLTALHDLGVRIAIDDFGTASSSLPYLRDLPIDLIKVDRSFIEGISRDPEDSAVAAAIIGLAHTLGITAVAEGVETVEHLAELKALECDEAHGFLFSRPLPAAELRPYLRHVFAV